MTRKWKIGGSVVLALLMGIAMIRAAQADVRVGTLPTGSAFWKPITVTRNMSQGTGGIITTVGVGTVLYGFSVQPGTANTECGLYDVSPANSTSANLVAANLIDEGGSATQYNTFQSNWPAPYKLTAGLFVHVSGTASSVTSTCVVMIGA